MRLPLLLFPLLCACLVEGRKDNDDDLDGDEGGGEGGGDTDSTDSGASDEGGGTDEGGGSDEGGSTGSTGGSTGSGDGDDGTTTTCSITARDPVDGATDFYYRDIPSVTLARREGEPYLELTTDGFSLRVAGDMVVDGATISYVPDEPLSPDTEYGLTLIYCDGEMREDWTFRTSRMGLPLEVDPSGNLYLLDLTSGAWTSPEGLSEMVGSFVAQAPLLQLESAGETIEWTASASVDLSSSDQDSCMPTNTLLGDFSTNPSFETSLTEGAFPVAITTSAPWSFQDFTMSGVLAPDGSSVEEVQLSFATDMRAAAEDLGALVGTSDPAELCSLMSSFGATCVTCSSDGEPWCVNWAYEGGTMSQVTGELEWIDELNCHEDCAASASNPECDTSGW